MPDHDLCLASNNPEPFMASAFCWKRLGHDGPHSWQNATTATALQPSSPNLSGRVTDTKEVTERGVAGEAKGVGRIPPDAPVGRDTDEGRTDLASRSLDVPRSVTSPDRVTEAALAAAEQRVTEAERERDDEISAWGSARTDEAIQRKRADKAVAERDVLEAALRRILNTSGRITFAHEIARAALAGVTEQEGA